MAILAIALDLLKVVLEGKPSGQEKRSSQIRCSKRQHIPLDSRKQQQSSFLAVQHHSCSDEP